VHINPGSLPLGLAHGSKIAGTEPGSLTRINLQHAYLFVTVLKRSVLAALETMTQLGMGMHYKLIQIKETLIQNRGIVMKRGCLNISQHNTNEPGER